MEISVINSNVLRFLKSRSQLAEVVSAGEKEYRELRSRDWDLADNYLFTAFENNVYNWTFFHPIWRNPRFLDPRILEVGKFFDFLNREGVSQFLNYYPRFYRFLKSVFAEGSERFKVVGRPIIEAVTDPETGGDFHLIIYFPVERRDREEIRKLINFRKYVRRVLRPDERLLINCFLR